MINGVARQSVRKLITTFTLSLYHDNLAKEQSVILFFLNVEIYYDLPKKSVYKKLVL